MSKAVLITGGSKRIGKAIAKYLVTKKYKIIIHYNTSANSANKLKDELSKNTECQTLKLNLNQYKKANTLIKKALNIFPDLDLLINNASLFKEQSFLNTSIDLFDKHININLKSPFFLTQEFAKQVNSGNIINILDQKITDTSTKYFSYLLSKKSLADLTLMLSRELAPKIRVNGICPGLILPPDNKNDKYLNNLAKKIPLKKKGTINNIIQTIDFILKNDYLTGDLFFIDGGQHLK